MDDSSSSTIHASPRPEEGDVEAPRPDQPTYSHQRTTSEITYGSPPQSRDYTVDDLQGDDKALQAEGDVIEAIEGSSLDLKGNANSILMPVLPDEHSDIFEPDQKTDMPKRQVKKSVHGFRDLTAQLMAVNPVIHRRAQSEEPWETGLDTATRGTAVDRMANAAEMMFKTEGKLPEGIAFESEDGQPVLSASTRPGQATSAGKQRAIKQIKVARGKVKENRELFMDYIKPRKQFLMHYWWLRFKFAILPGVGIAALLFYAFDNPPHGSLFDGKLGLQEEDAETGDVPSASTSYWILFFVRQVVTFSSAKMWEMFLVDFLAVRTRILTAIVGPYVSLWIAQSKGWPFRAVAWGLIDLIFLYGTSDFVNHWLFWQDSVDLFNTSNPSGEITNNDVYKSVIYCSIGFGGLTAVKRVILSNIMGKRLVVNYGVQLERLMKDVLLVTQIAFFSRRIAKGSIAVPAGEELDDVMSQDDTATNATPSLLGPATGRFDSYSYLMSSGKDDMILGLLEEWEDPQSQSDRVDRKSITISSLLHFRRALAFIDAEYPFSEAFGPANTRNLCVKSSQNVFKRLAGTREETINFSVFAPMAQNDDEEIDRTKMKEIWKLLRPSGKGMLTKLDFVKSIDKVYKNMRTLVASIESSSQIEKNYEAIVNTIHYFIISMLGLSIIGVNVDSLLVSLSALFVGVGFIIGNACSKFLEGLLMIFIQRPFDIGDRIAIGDATGVLGLNGQSAWIVEKVNLYSTTMRFAATREVATVTNGQLALTRITNMQRSKKAMAYINLKFGIDVSNETVGILKNEIKEFVDARPREWESLSAFRMTDIEADLGYVAYIIVLQHRESWQNVGAILTSKAELSAFALERSKELGMRYVAPSLPVDISLSSKKAKDAGPSEDNENLERILGLLEDKKSK